MDMQSKIIALMASCFILIAHITHGQEDLQPIIEEVIENIVANYDEDADLSELTDRLYRLAVNPVYLNSANASTLAEIPLLSGYQVNQLLNYRKRFGSLRSIFEMQNIDGFDKTTIQLIRPFITLDEDPGSDHTRRRLYFRHDAILRNSRVIQQQKGYEPDSTQQRYIGDPLKTYFRYVISSDVGEAGITADKDAGEAFLKDPNKSGFDFYSGHVFLEDLGVVEKVALGDYSMSFGQGINLWSGFSMGKSNPVSGSMKLPNGIRPYRSATEGGFFRGAATTLKFKKISLSTFYSNQKIDANKVFNSDSSGYTVTSIDIGGYHRTANELEDENSLRETLYGINAAYDYNGLHVGITAHQSKYDHQIIPQQQMYNQFRFSGDKNLVKGLDFSWVIKKAEWFGEVSFDKDNDIAWLAGANFYLHPRLMLYMLHRNYDKRYNNLLAAATGEYSHTTNEKGWLYGMRFDIHKHWYFNGYLDIFSSQWLNYGSESPSSGKEMEAKINYIPNRKSSAYIRFFYEEKQVNSNAEGSLIQQTTLRERWKLRFHFSKTINKLDLRSRVERSFASVENEKSNGFLVYQDIIYSIDEEALKIYGRYAYFETDDYASRIYAYENDVLYAFSFPAYYNKGSRYFLMLSYKWKRMSFWLRYASTSYRDKEVILSGLNEIEGNTVSELKFQVRMKF